MPALAKESVGDTLINGTYMVRPPGGPRGLHSGLGRGVGPRTQWNRPL